ncbi:MAG: T9SS type A sorting domain-containing protein [Saprospiraceae bacterium]|jgi:hypothetical protein|nr:T9SS type A sorting domain-containing protein [Saprospiraceae bacterium]
MKRFILLLSFFLSFVVVKADITYKPSHLAVVAAPNSGDQLLEILITNTLNTQLPVYWKLVKDNSFKQNWETYICDTEFCYSVNVDQSNTSLPNNLKPGTHKFEFHFNAKNTLGNANVALKLYSDKTFTKEIKTLNINLNATYLKQTPAELAINTTPSSGDNKLNITYVNSHDTTYTVFWKVIKDNTTWKPQWETFICDLEFCYGNNVDQSMPNLPNKFKKGNSLIEFHFFPNNVSGNTSVTLKLYADKNFTQEIFSSVIQINNGLSGSQEIVIEKLNVSPSPATDFINLPENQNIRSVEIITSNGQFIRTAQIENSSSIQINDLSTGVYFIKAFDAKSQNIGISKFVKL